MENYGFNFGDEMVFNGASDEQVGFGSNDDPRHWLKVGEIYRIRSFIVGSWHTKLEFEGFRGRFFNSASFSKVQ